MHVLEMCVCEHGIFLVTWNHVLKDVVCKIIYIQINHNMLQLTDVQKKAPAEHWKTSVNKLIKTVENCIPHHGMKMYLIMHPFLWLIFCRRNYSLAVQLWCQFIGSKQKEHCQCLCGWERVHFLLILIYSRSRTYYPTYWLVIKHWL